MRNFFVIIIIACSLIPVSLSSQSITSYSFNVIALNTSADRAIFSELKTFANIDDLNLEVDGFYNFKGKEWHKTSLGLGFNYNISTEQTRIFVPIQFELFPMIENRKFSLVYEIAPQLTNDVYLRHLFGFRYSFNRD